MRLIYEQDNELSNSKINLNTLIVSFEIVLIVERGAEKISLTISFSVV